MAVDLSVPQGNFKRQCKNTRLSLLWWLKMRSNKLESHGWDNHLQAGRQRTRKRPPQNKENAARWKAMLGRAKVSAKVGEWNTGFRGMEHPYMNFNIKHLRPLRNLYWPVSTIWLPHLKRRDVALVIWGKNSLSRILYSGVMNTLSLVIRSKNVDRAGRNKNLKASIEEAWVLDSSLTLTVMRLWDKQLYLFILFSHRPVADNSTYPVQTLRVARRIKAKWIFKS